MAESGPLCLACMESIEICSVPTCNHKNFCFKCSLKQRLLYDNKSCPMCKVPCEDVIVTDLVRKTYNGLKKRRELVTEKHSGVTCTSDAVATQVASLFAITCSVCQQSFKKRGDLKNHLSSVHSLYHCNVCLKSRKVFLGEQVLYSKKELKKHMTKGDQETRLKGHPKCHFCNNKHYDDAALYAHMKEKHHECGVCSGRGVEYQYFADYKELSAHWRQNKRDHWLCEFGCEFAIFPDELGLRQHKLREHKKQLGKSESKRLAKVDDIFEIRVGSSAAREPAAQSRAAAPPATVVRPAVSPEARLRAQISSKLPLPPANGILARQRNDDVVQILIAEAGQDVVSHFRSKAIAFRDGHLSCQEYFDTFLGIFGAQTTEAVLPALISLCPSEKQRRELEEFYVDFVVKKTFEDKKKNQEQRNKSKKREETTYKCANCRKMHPMQLFSKSQFKKMSSRKCRDCVANQQRVMAEGKGGSQAGNIASPLAPIPKAVFQVKEKSFAAVDSSERAKRDKAKSKLDKAVEASHQTVREAQLAKEKKKQDEMERKRNLHLEAERNRAEKLKRKQERKKQEKERRRREYEASQRAAGNWDEKNSNSKKTSSKSAAAPSATAPPIVGEKVVMMGAPPGFEEVGAWETNIQPNAPPSNAWGVSDFPSLPGGGRSNNDDFYGVPETANRGGRKKKKNKKQVLFKFG